MTSTANQLIDDKLAILHHGAALVATRDAGDIRPACAGTNEGHKTCAR